MNRLDFHSVATLLQNHLIETADMTQIVFISTLFSCFVNDSDFSFDEGLCCKWIKGQAKISPKIVSYYQISKHQEEMYADMEEERRMFYVAFTRAKNNLHKYYVNER